MNPRILELRGKQTETYTSFGGKDSDGFPIYGDSKVYYVTNVGQDRAEILTLLEDFNVEILEEVSMFKYICIALEKEEVSNIDTLLRTIFNSPLQWDGA